MNPILQLDGICKSFGGVSTAKDVSFTRLLAGATPTLLTIDTWVSFSVLLLFSAGFR